MATDAPAKPRERQRSKKSKNKRNKPRASQILIVEDEESLVDVLTYNLTREGFSVQSALDGRDGLSKAQKNLPDLIILDLMLPEMEGLQVCQHIRTDHRTAHIPILMLTARSEEIDEIVGFQMGADDYVPKPFKIKPLIQRIRSLLRRARTREDSADFLVVNGMEIDRVRHRTVLDDEELFLTRTEFKLLWTLASQPGRAFSRQELMDSCRGEDAPSLERTIDVHIRSLRQKLADRADLIETVRGVGYRFSEGGSGSSEDGDETEDE